MDLSSISNTWLDLLLILSTAFYKKITREYIIPAMKGLKPVCLVGICVILPFLSPFFLNQYIKRRRSKKRLKKNFKQNGGLLMKQKVSSFGSNEGPKIFTAKELKKATDNYNKKRLLGQGGNGTVYKGILPDGNIVAVKKSHTIQKNQIDQFINEVAILSQINHRNIVQLNGFCLETEVPMLVYEFISNGTLSDHLQKQDPKSSLSWETRFRIACDVAGALAYMHSAISMPIYHRDIKPANILLDENYNAKVSDFGASRSVPYDKTHLTTAVQGTFGYIDPGYYHSSQFSEKSDVYSFGVTLVELLTGKSPFSFAGDEGRNLVATFMELNKDNRLYQILDYRVIIEANQKVVFGIAELATKCLSLNAKTRPTMKEVFIELEGHRNNC